MKLSLVFPGLALLSQLGSAIPTPTENLVDRAIIVKRATISDVANLGYAQTNGGYVRFRYFGPNRKVPNKVLEQPEEKADL